MTLQPAVSAKLGFTFVFPSCGDLSGPGRAVLLLVSRSWSVFGLPLLLVTCLCWRIPSIGKGPDSRRGCSLSASLTRLQLNLLSHWFSCPFSSPSYWIMLQNPFSVSQSISLFQLCLCCSPCCCNVKCSGRNVKFPHLKVSYHILELAMRQRTFLVLPALKRKGKLQAQCCLVSAEALETSLFSWKLGCYYLVLCQNLSDS